MTIDITKRIEWLKKRMKMSELEEGYIKLMLQDIATEVASNTESIGNVSDFYYLKDGDLVKNGDEYYRDETGEWEVIDDADEPYEFEEKHMYKTRRKI